MEIVFMRHGQTEWNARHVLQGANAEIPLTEAGVRQAETAAEQLVRMGWTFDRVYVSPYRRAQQTADIICARVGGTPITDGRIREMSFGVYEGTPYLHGDYADDNIRQAFECPERYVPRGGESYADVLARVGGFLERELRTLDGRCSRVLVVAHGGVLRAVAMLVTKTPLGDYWKGLQPNCCAHLVDLTDGIFRLRARAADIVAGVDLRQPQRFQIVDSK